LCHKEKEKNIFGNYREKVQKRKSREKKNPMFAWDFSEKQIFSESSTNYFIFTIFPFTRPNTSG